MSDFEMEFELTGLKVKIKSNRGEASDALQNFNNQVGGLLQAAAEASTNHPQTKAALPSNVSAVRTIDAPMSPEAGKSKVGKRKRGNGGGGTPLDFRHDVGKFGSPKQSWNTAQKSMWLLYIIEKQGGDKEQNTPTITATFNKYFKEFGPVTTTNVTRDLGGARVKHGFVSSDAGKEPQTWFLLEAGTKEVEKLMSSATAEPPK